MASFGDIALAFAGGAAQQINEDAAAERNARLKLQNRIKEMQAQQKIELRKTQYASDLKKYEEQQIHIRNLKSMGDDQTAQQRYILENIQGRDFKAFMTRVRNGEEMPPVSWVTPKLSRPQFKELTDEEAAQMYKTESSIRKIFRMEEEPDQPQRKDVEPTKEVGELMRFGGGIVDWNKSAEPEKLVFNKQGDDIVGSDPFSGEQKSRIKAPEKAKEPDVVSSKIDHETGVASLIVDDGKGNFTTKTMQLEGFKQIEEDAQLYEKANYDSKRGGFSIIERGVDGQPTSRFIKTDGIDPEDSEKYRILSAKSEDPTTGEVTQNWIVGKVEGGKFVETDIRALEVGTPTSKTTLETTQPQVEMVLANMKVDSGVRGDFFKDMSSKEQDAAAIDIAGLMNVLRTEPEYSRMSDAQRLQVAYQRYFDQQRKREMIQRLQAAKAGQVQQ